jgi:hypothetical protein
MNVLLLFFVLLAAPLAAQTPTPDIDFIKLRDEAGAPVAGEHRVRAAAVCEDVDGDAVTRYEAR